MIRSSHLLIPFCCVASLVLSGCASDPPANSTEAPPRDSPPTLSILQAAREGSVDEVGLHVQAKTDLSRADDDGNTPLHLAVANRHEGVVGLLIENGASPNVRNAAKQSPIDLAIEAGDLPIVEALLQAGVKPDQFSEEPALHRACRLGHLEIAEALLKAGWDPLARDVYARRPLQIATENKHPEIVELLTRQGGQPLSPFSGRPPSANAFWAAIESDNTKLAEEMLEKLLTVRESMLDRKARPPRLVERQRKVGINEQIPNHGILLQEAAKAGNLKVVEFLLAHGARLQLPPETLLQDNPALQPGNTSAVHHAAAGGHLAVVQRLLASDANVDATDAQGRTALFLAAADGHAVVVSYLLDHGAKADGILTPVLDRTPLMVLLDRAENRVDPDRRADFVQAANLLLARNADVNAKTQFGMTVLHYAAQYGNLEIIKALLDRGALADAKTSQGQLPQQIAERLGHSEIAKVLSQSVNCK